MKTPWDAMVRAGMLLGIKPDGFWRLSLKEWRMLTEPYAALAPMGREALARMTEAWPDE